MCELTVKQQQSKGQTRPIPIFTWAIVALIIVFGLVACACFIVFGVTAANNDQRQQFQRVADEFISHIEAAFEEYRAAGLWIHQACHNRNISRVEYGELYEHLTSHGLDVLGANMVFNITDDEREAMEQEARQFYGEFYPELEYNGIVGLEPDNSSDTGYSVQPRSQQPFYYAVHLIAPVLENFKAADFDLYSSATRRETIYSALNTWEPALTERLVLVQETEGTYSVVLMHPGIPLSSRPEAVPRDLSNIVIRIPDLLNRATDSQTDPVSIYLYDSASSDTDEFLGGLSIEADANATRRFMAEIEIGALRASQAQGHQQERVVQVADKKWTVVVLSAQGTYEPKLTFILLGGIITLVGSVCVALWVLTNTWRVSKISQMKAMADQEKAALIVENAKNATRLERELNDWISHEVRNPVSAAMSACTFVKNSLKQDKPLKDAKVLQSAREDVQIIDNSLQFINDLLRNMLDMHRASSNQLKVAMKPTDIKQDVFEPVDSMLYRRGCTFDVIIDCPDDLIVMTDRLRLKQVILNLGRSNVAVFPSFLSTLVGCLTANVLSFFHAARNSTKFLSSGFIRLKATVENDRVVLYVEDSGTGIPKEKRPILFAKFQESLDNLNQGTVSFMSACACK
jgi:signal transduction histidine kinase